MITSKNLFPFLILGGAVLLAGCESMSERMQDRLTVVPPKIRTFTGSLEKVQSAAQQAFRRLDFTLVRSRSSEIEAVSRINSSTAFADARQMVAKVHLAEAGPGQIDVEVTLREEVASNSMGGTHQQNMREHSFFELYFATVQQVLQEDEPAAPVKKP